MRAVRKEGQNRQAEVAPHLSRQQGLRSRRDQAIWNPSQPYSRDGRVAEESGLLRSLFKKRPIEVSPRCDQQRFRRIAALARGLFWDVQK